MSDKIEIINQWKLSNIFSELENGNLKIPRFQRSFVWERSKIAKLLNSIYKEYPIGSFFVWEAGAGYAHFSREITELGLPEEPQYGNYQFILDGQQRVTSLYIALKKRIFNNDNYDSICFNLEQKEFKLRRLISEKHNIPAWKLFDTQAYGDVYAEYMNSDRKLADVWRNCQEIFANYPISLIKTKNMGLEEVVDIFERINQAGKRLTLFDLVHASAWSDKFDLRDKIDEFNKGLKDKFGKIVPEVFTQSLSLNAFGDCKNTNQLNLTADICIELWDKTVECIRKSIDYVVSNLGVKSVEFIPYPSFLAIIQHYFHKSAKKSIDYDHQTFINNWFWTATFSSRYSSSTLTKMKDDADWIAGLANNDKRENVFSVAISPREIIKIRMNITSAVKNGILCLYALENPLDFNNGQPVTLDKSYVSKSNAKENHHFFPYSLRQRFNADVNAINSVVNLAFISQSLNREILNSLPSIYIDNYRQINQNIDSHLLTHFIDQSVMDAIQHDNYQEFLNSRAKLIQEKITSKIDLPSVTKILPDDIVEDIIDDEVDFPEEAVNE